MTLTNEQIELVEFVIKSNLNVRPFIDWENVSEEDKQLYEDVEKHLLSITFDGNTMSASEENLSVLLEILEVHLNHVINYIDHYGDENGAKQEKESTKTIIDIIKLKIGE